MRFTESKRWRTAVLVVVPLFLILGPLMLVAVTVLAYGVGAPDAVAATLITAISFTWLATFALWLIVVPFFGLRALASTAVFFLVWVSSCVGTQAIADHIAPEATQEFTERHLLVNIAVFAVLLVLHWIAAHIVERRDWRADVERRRAALGVEERE